MYKKIELYLKIYNFCQRMNTAELINFWNTANEEQRSDLTKMMSNMKIGRAHV